MKIAKIVSGGQTGADTGALEAAIWCKLPHGGWCPSGRRCEDGTIPLRYEVTEMPTSSYAMRTEANIVDSDATLLFTFGQPTGGSKLTAELAEKHSRPFFHVDLNLHETDFVPELSRRFFVNADRSETGSAHFALNVAGSRESQYPGIADMVELWMIEIISHVNGRTYYPPSHLRKMSSFVLGNESQL